MLLPPITAEPIFNIGSFPVTNALINGWIAVVLFIIIGLIAKKRKDLIPKGIHNVFEAIVEFILDTIQTVTHDRERAKKFLPLVGSLFLFILISNWMGLFPGTGSIGVYQFHHGEVELIPILRPAASDLNLTLAMALIAVIGSHIFGIFTIGFFKHANKFIQLGTLWSSVRKGGINIFIGLVEFMVGIIELVSEAAKVVSLSLRLFGNIFAGEVLLTVIAGLVAFFVPLPFMGLELIVGIIQAMVFSLLTLVYLTVATEKISH